MDRSADRHKNIEGRKQYHKDNFERISIVIRRDSGISEGLKKAVANGNTRNAYIVEAIKRMLQFDDYMD